MLYLAIITAVAILDQAAKMWATSGALESSIEIIPGVIGFELLKNGEGGNTGAAFGILSGHTLLLTIISAVAVVLLIVVIFAFKKDTTVFIRSCLAVITGGALGNLIDRVFAGYVVDFIEFRFFEFPVFNVADAFITVGAIALVIYIVFTKKGHAVFASKKEKKEKRVKVVIKEETHEEEK